MRIFKNRNHRRKVQWLALALLFTGLTAFVGCGKDEANIATEGGPKFTDGAHILKLYQLVKDIHDVFRKNDITYWVDGGTLIGTIRHKGIIPWDDDADLGLPEDQIGKFIAVIPLFEAMGYGITSNEFCYNIHDKIVPGKPTPTVDLFIMQERNGKFYYKDSRSWGKRNGEQVYYKREEVFPQKEYEFGIFKVMGPNNYTEFMNSVYGADWMDVGYYFPEHVADPSKPIKKVKVVLTPEMRRPAQPTGPLEDRVK